MNEQVANAHARNLARLMKRLSDIQAKIEAGQGLTGTVVCTTCKREQGVDVAQALWAGWPACCGFTMSLVPRAPSC